MDELNNNSTKLNNKNDKLISRQAAIDAVNDVIADYIPNIYGRYEALPFEMASAINRLPSAQPEIIRCGECKHSFLHDNGEKISRICGLTRMCGTTPDDWFCADAERKEE